MCRPLRGGSRIISAAIEFQFAVYQLIHEIGAVKTDIIPISGFVHWLSIILSSLAQLTVFVHFIGAGSVDNGDFLEGETAFICDKLLCLLIGQNLSGRSKEIHLYPFSFPEYCEAFDVDISKLTTKAEAFRRKAFDDYSRQGGFPELLHLQDKRSYVSGLVKNILTRDIEQRYQISYKSEFEEMAQHLLNISPTSVVATDLKYLFHFKSEHTAKKYVDYLKQAFVLTGLRKYSRKSRVRATKEKVYAVDVAMMDKRENAFAGDNLGWRLETIVFSHLLRKSKIEGLDIYYLSERSSKCDFIVCKGNATVHAIQVSYDISNEKTFRREINGLKTASRITGCKDLLLLTDHDRGTHKDGDLEIRIMPVYEWSITLTQPTNE